MTGRVAGPLSGVRVLTLENFGAGPFGSMYLADLGAEVIKIENRATGGDASRGMGPYFLGEHDSQYFQTFNLNKKSCALNLKTPLGRAAFHRLVGSADAVMNNLRGDQPALLGLRHEDLKSINPRIVCAHLSAYGREGSRVNWPGYDYLMQAEVGYLSVTGEPDGPPARFGLSMVDLMTGLTTAFGLVAAILGARTTGIGTDVDVSLFDTALHNLNYPGTWYLNSGTVTGREPRGAHPSLTPSQLYRTADGWLFVMCNKEKFWAPFVTLIGCPQWAAHPDYRDFTARLKHRDKLTQDLDAVLMMQTTAHWLALLQGTIPVAPVHDIAQALERDFVHERGSVHQYDAAQGPDMRLLVNPIGLGGATLPHRHAPALGADTDQLLTELGYHAAAIKALRAEGAIG
jgi:crotonobetainyl-CoA:carnitine CoA-transferase CaiB-like acyl-CoA transferase